MVEIELVGFLVCETVEHAKPLQVNDLRAKNTQVKSPGETVRKI
jgi:hypothetical protein